MARQSYPSLKAERLSLRANGDLVINAGADDLAADIAWCRAHNVRVRFHSNGTVEVMRNGKTRRRKTLHEAIEAHRSDKT